MYSKENRIVITHSAMFKSCPYLLFIDSTLSNITNKILARIANSKTTSKNLPALVSAS